MPSASEATRASCLFVRTRWFAAPCLSANPDTFVSQPGISARVALGASVVARVGFKTDDVIPKRVGADIDTVQDFYRLAIVSPTGHTMPVLIQRGPGQWFVALAILQ